MDCPLPPPSPTATQCRSTSRCRSSGLEGAQPSVPPGSVSVCRAGIGLGSGSWKAGLGAAWQGGTTFSPFSGLASTLPHWGPALRPPSPQCPFTSTSSHPLFWVHSSLPPPALQLCGSYWADCSYSGSDLPRAPGMSVPLLSPSLRPGPRLALSVPLSLILCLPSVGPGPVPIPSNLCLLEMSFRF